LVSEHVALMTVSQKVLRAAMEEGPGGGGRRKRDSNQSSWSCFAFLSRRPKKSSGSCFPCLRFSDTSAAADEVNLKRLPELEDACLSVKGHCCSVTLIHRRLNVMMHLLPVVARIAVDNLRSGGPKHALANTRRLRLALQALGPAFVKLGQAMATREDVLSDQVAAELRKLCDQVAPFDDEEAWSLVLAQLGKEAPETRGTRVAAASLGQVYRLTVGKTEYAMKVQRPGLTRALAMDVVILKGVAKFIRFVVRRVMVSAVDPVQVVDDWAQTLWNELDYNMEARCMDDMRSALSNIRGLLIPRVCHRLTSLRVLTTEWINGEKITENPKCVNSNHISIGVETFAAMILSVGVVHADPHPGNLIISGEDEVCLLDFGMVCQVPPSHRKAWAQCIVHLVHRDHEAVLDDLILIGFFPRNCPRGEIMPVMSKIWTQLVECGSDIKKRKEAVQMLYGEILTLVRRFEFGLPDYYVALVRALVTLEGIALAADCDFDIFKAIFPCALRFLTESSGADRRALSLALMSSGLTSCRSISGSLLRSACSHKLGLGISSCTTATLASVVLLALSAVAMARSGA